MKKPRSERAKFVPRRFVISSREVLDRALLVLGNLPIDPLRPLEIVAREEVKVRKLDQNALMWAGPLKDIAEQAWLEGRQYSAEIWAHYFKVHFLPEEFDPELCKEGYVKWSFDPDGDRVLTGSTTQLSIKGMAQHIEQIHAFGGSLGVEFSAPPAKGYQ